MDNEIDQKATDTLAAIRGPSDLSASLASSYNGRGCRRRIDRRAGRALELLGHAIEYLTDELIEEGGPSTAGDGRVQAIQILMALNRQIYLDCPEVPTLAGRVRKLIGALGYFLD